MKPKKKYVYDAPVRVRLTAHLKSLVDAESEVQAKSVSEIIREALRHYYKIATERPTK